MADKNIYDMVLRNPDEITDLEEMRKELHTAHKHVEVLAGMVEGVGSDIATLVFHHLRGDAEQVVLHLEHIVKRNVRIIPQQESKGVH